MRLADFALTREIAINTALAVPALRARNDARKLDEGCADDKDDADYPQRAFERHAAVLRAHRAIDGADVLEIGPGGNLGTALQFIHAGAGRVTCIDIFPWLKDQPELYAQLVP